MNQSFWQQVKSNIHAKNSNNKLIQTWFDPTTLISSEEAGNKTFFRLGVPNELHKYWLSENLMDRICSEISSIHKKPFQVELIVTGETPEYSLQQMTMQNSDQTSEEPEAFTTPISSKPESHRSDNLNPEYLFQTFVVGRNNEFAHAASFNIAENPGKQLEYNPFFIYGPTGMGKTHLINAVGNHIKARFPQVKIIYITAERFMNECIKAIRFKDMDNFRKKYRNSADIFLVDDVQILGRGEAVQEEFFYTLNDFIEKGRQVVVASDRMPKDINGLADRIRTRLEWGVIADIQMPDLETRMAILRYKAEQRSIKLPEDVTAFIARISKRSIRELEGNLNKIKMFTELQGLPISLDLAKQVLANHSTEASSLTVADLQKMVCDHYNIRLTDLKSSGRAKPIVTARQVAMYLIKKHLDKSLQDIGRAFGGKDHSTVINAIRRIQDQQEKDSDLRSDIDELENRVHNLVGL